MKPHPYPQCDYCKLTIWPDSQLEIVRQPISGPWVHKICIEEAELNRMKELIQGFTTSV